MSPAVRAATAVPGRGTLVALAWTAALALLAAAPDLLAGLGLVGEDSLQATVTLAGMFFGVPAMVLALLAVALSIRDFASGPAGLRTRLALWWALVAGAVSLSLVLPGPPAFNPYLGSARPPFDVRDAVLLTGLMAGVGLPLFWIRRGGDRSPATAADRE